MKTEVLVATNKTRQEHIDYIRRYVDVPAERWRDGWRWITKGDDKLRNVFLRFGYLYTVPKGHPLPRKATLERVIAKYGQPANSAQLAVVYELALLGE